MIYALARAILRWVLLLRRWNVGGLQHMPKHGGVIVASNHISYWDPVVVGCCFQRRVYFMAKAELFRYPVFGSLLRILGAFPVHRSGADRQAIRTALQHLKQGRVLGIFPEGTRSKTGKMLAPQMGTALIALKAGVPVLPVAVSGTRGVFGKIKVKIGKPLVFQNYYAKKPSKEDLKKVSEVIMEHIAALHSSLG
ncbi:MAG: 1-acyl-sn-glycerol-3-phosphate acyltransferase [Peptococcaceae bacterium]|nr:1-acyl-sn-glycerol-3-phosphate acyltransferase [Peptococcaceae bacterium]